MPISQPNILVIQADQLNPRMLGAYNNPIASTPHIDALAASGTVFEAAYSNFPLCAPSRFSMMSGQLASKIGAFDNGAEFPSSFPTFAHYLRALNYQTCLVGKMHFVGADQLHGFEERLTTDIYPANFNWTGDWTEVRSDSYVDDIGFKQAGVCVRNMQMEYDEEVCHRAKRKLFDLARSSSSDPFLLFTSLTHPHDPYQCLQTHWDRYRHEEIDMPRVGSIAWDDLDPYSQRLRQHYGLDSFAITDDQIRIVRHAYYGSISYLDDLVGDLMKVLTDTGLIENTIIILTSDHGDLLGERGLWYKKSFYEDACKVPLIVSGKGMQENRVTENVSLVDLLPTLLDIAGDTTGSTLVEEIEGDSLWSHCSSSASLSNRPIYSENLAEGANAPVLMVKQNNMKLVCSPIDPDQLFDLNEDPLELENCAGDARYTSQLDTLTALANKKWDVEALSASIRLSQDRRLFLRKSLNKGIVTNWDYAAKDETIDHCLRGKKTYNQWAYGSVLKPIKPTEKT